MSKLAIFDCDSTLSSIEGIDELARLRGDAVLKEVAALTNAAMDGEVPLGEVFGRRIDIIQPDQALCDTVANLYIETVEPHAKDVIETLRADGWTPIILSGGFAPLILPLADYLNIDRVEAVPLHLDADGKYIDFGRDYPTTRNGGKPEIIQQFLAEYQPAKTIMIGDGVSDLETAPFVDLFVGYGGYTRRTAVESAAEHFITRLIDLLPVIDTHWGS